MEAVKTAKRHALRYRSLVDGSSLWFPCDDKGLVDLDRLSRRQRDIYLYARALVRRHYEPPIVVAFDAAAVAS
jgi:hypothetical protein